MQAFDASYFTETQYNNWYDVVASDEVFNTISDKVVKFEITAAGDEGASAKFIMQEGTSWTNYAEISNVTVGDTVSYGDATIDKYYKIVDNCPKEGCTYECTEGERDVTVKASYTEKVKLEVFSDNTFKAPHVAMADYSALEIQNHEYTAGDKTFAFTVEGKTVTAYEVAEDGTRTETSDPKLSWIEVKPDKYLVMYDGQVVHTTINLNEKINNFSFAFTNDEAMTFKKVDKNGALLPGATIEMTSGQYSTGWTGTYPNMYQTYTYTAGDAFSEFNWENKPASDTMDMSQLQDVTYTVDGWGNPTYSNVYRIHETDTPNNDKYVVGDDILLVKYDGVIYWTTAINGTAPENFPLTVTNTGSYWQPSYSLGLNQNSGWNSFDPADCTAEERTLTMVNYEISGAKVTLAKTDMLTDAYVAGAKLALYAVPEDGSADILLYEFTSKAGPFKLTTDAAFVAATGAADWAYKQYVEKGYIKPGTYYFAETQAPENYTEDLVADTSMEIPEDKRMYFTVNDDDTVVEGICGETSTTYSVSAAGDNNQWWSKYYMVVDGTVLNKDAEDASAVFVTIEDIKKIEINAAAGSAASATVYSTIEGYVNGKSITFTDGVAVIDDLPELYTSKFEVGGAGVNIESFTFYTKSEPTNFHENLEINTNTSTITISNMPLLVVEKVDEEGEYVENAGLTVYKVGTVTLDNDGKITALNKFENDEVTTITNWNTNDVTKEIVKLDENDQPILDEETGEPEMETVLTSKILPDLEDGIYLLEETSTPEGYRTAAPIYFIVVDGRLIDMLMTVTDNGFELDEEKESPDVVGNTLVMVDKELLNELTIGKKDITGQENVQGATLTLTLTEPAEQGDTLIDVTSEGTFTFQDTNHMVIEWISDGSELLLENLPDGRYTFQETGDDFIYDGRTFTVVEGTVVFDLVDGVLTVVEGTYEDAPLTETNEDTESYYVVDAQTGKLLACDASAEETTTTTEETTTTTEETTTTTEETTTTTEETTTTTEETTTTTEETTTTTEETTTTTEETTTTTEETTTTTEETTAETTIATVSVVISKQDINGVEIEGAQLIVYEVGEDDSRTEVTSWISAAGESKSIEGLEANQIYVLEEQLAPNGYLVAEDIYFYVDEDNNVFTSEDGENFTAATENKVVMVDAPTAVTISKQDIAGEEIGGAKLTITYVDENGVEQTIDSWVSEAGVSHEITGLTADRVYTLVEEQVPTDAEGNEMYTIAESINFLIDGADGKVYIVTLDDAGNVTGMEEAPENTVVMVDGTTSTTTTTTTEETTTTTEESTTSTEESTASTEESTTTEETTTSTEETTTSTEETTTSTEETTTVTEETTVTTEETTTTTEETTTTTEETTVETEASVTETSTTAEIVDIYTETTETTAEIVDIYTETSETTAETMDIYTETAESTTTEIDIDSSMTDTTESTTETTTEETTTTTTTTEATTTTTASGGNSPDTGDTSVTGIAVTALAALMLMGFVGIKTKKDE